MVRQRVEHEERVFVALPLKLPLDLLCGEVLHDSPIAYGVGGALAVGSPDQKRYGVFGFWKKRFEAPPGDDAYIGVDHESSSTTARALRQRRVT